MTIYPCPKPPAGRSKPVRLNRRNKSDGKVVEICRSSTAWDERREEVGIREDFQCQECGEPAPLHNEEIEREEGEMPYLIRAGQAAHIDARKMGGGSRDDNPDNLCWLCWVCHHYETIGQPRPGYGYVRVTGRQHVA